MSYKPFNHAEETAVRLMLRYPYFMGIYYSMALFELPADWPAPFNTLATNGVSLWFNKSFWDQLSRDQKMTAIAHECGHKMYLHTTRRGERNKAAWNIAGDHVINLGLVESGFAPLEGLTINGKPWSWCCDEKYKGWTTEQVYDDVMQQAQNQAGKGGDAESILVQIIGDAADIVDFGEDGAGDRDESGKGKVETSADFEQRVRGELREMEIMARMAGNAPAWMSRVVKNVDHAKVNWYEVVENLLKSLHLADYSWRRFNRREFVKSGVLSPDMWEPVIGGIVVYVDCSGSCWDSLDEFNMHFKDIIGQIKPKWVEVRYFQTEVTHEIDQRFERGEFDVALQPSGNGGTSFVWLNSEVSELPEEPDAVFVLTDMYGEFGSAVEGPPVYWLSVSAVNTAPFGEVISIN
jgi:predicted metal-dependent peptidase